MSEIGIVELYYYASDFGTYPVAFNQLKVLPGIQISSLTTTTQGNVESYAYGKVPTVECYGVGPRIIQLVGTFGKDSIPWNHSTIEEITNATYIMPGYAVDLKTDNTNTYPELKYGKWIINKFIWDRKAAAMGKWEFNMELQHYPNDGEYLYGAFTL